jgi:hypothetical protein
VVEKAVPPVTDAADLIQVHALRDFDHRVIEFLARRDIDRFGKLERLFGSCRRVAADEGDRAIAIGRFDRFGRPHVHRERRSRGVQHHQIVIPSFSHRHFRGVVVRWSVEQARSGNQSRRIGEPGWIPKRPDLAGCLIT